jgi:hypothetical protein
MVMLISEMHVNALDHFERRLTHQRGDAKHVHAVENRRCAERVAGVIATQVLGQVQLPL